MHLDVLANKNTTNESDQQKISDNLDTDKVAKYSDSHSKQLDIQNALVLYVAGDLLPLSTVESPYFRNHPCEMVPWLTMVNHGYDHGFHEQPWLNHWLNHDWG